MQIGQVPIMFVPDAPVNSTAAITMEPDTGSTLIPSLQPFAPQPVALIDEAPRVPPWLMGALAIGAIYLLFFSKSPGR